MLHIVSKLNPGKHIPMIFIPFTTVAIEEFSDIYQKSLLILRLKDEIFLDYQEEIKAYIESALEYFVYEKMCFDENLVLNLIYSYLRLFATFKNNKVISSDDILFWIYFAILSLRLDKPNLISQSLTYCTSIKDIEEFLDILLASPKVHFKKELDQIMILLAKSKDSFGKKEEDEEHEGLEGIIHLTQKYPLFNQKLLSAFAITKEYQDELVDNENFSPDDQSPTLQQLDEFTRLYLPHYLNSPEIFTRTMRKSSQRKELLEKLKVTDEQLEGWAMVFSRNPHKNSIVSMFLEESNCSLNHAISNFEKL